MYRTFCLVLLLWFGKAQSAENAGAETTCMPLATDDVGMQFIALFSILNHQLMVDGNRPTSTGNWSKLGLNSKLFTVVGFMSRAF